MSLPVGTVVGMIGVDPDRPPSGWLYCDGSSFDGAAYPELAKVLPNNVLPNLIGLTLMGASEGAPYPASSYGYGNAAHQNPDGTYGSLDHTLAADEMPSHQHFGFGEHDGGWPFGTFDGQKNMGSKGGIDYDNYYYGTSFTGGTGADPYSRQPNNPFSLLQPSYAIYFFINAAASG